MIIDKLKQWITFNYDKSIGSKVSGVLNVISEELEQIQFAFKRIEEWEDVDNAEGQALDDLGQNILQFRGQSEDGIYRVLIRSKVARNKATTDYNNMLEIISLMLQIPFDEIQIKVGEHPRYQTIELLAVPLEKLNEIGMTSGQLGRILVSITAAGIGVDRVEFFGTFEFVDELEFNLELGYSDVDMLQGGTLGGLYQPANDTELPL